MSVSDYADAGVSSAMHFRVLGPDGGGPSLSELRRLFPGQRISAAWRSRLEQSGRILALCGPKVVGLAVYERTDREVRVNDVGIDPDSPCGIDGISNGLLDALELACLASGARRLLLLPRAGVSALVLGPRGYVAIAGGGAAGSWFEKRFV
jgi:hypothetical protein